MFDSAVILFDLPFIVLYSILSPIRSGTSRTPYQLKIVSSENQRDYEKCYQRKCQYEK